MGRLTSNVESIDEEMLTAPKDLKAHRWNLHCWKNWAGQCEGKIRDGNVKKGRDNETCHPWKPKVGGSSRDLLNLQYFDHKTGENVVVKKIGGKKTCFKNTFGLGSSNGLSPTGPIHQCIGNNTSANIQVIICRKVGKGKEDALILPSGKDKAIEIFTWIRWEPASGKQVASVYSSVGGGNSIFRKNGVKLIKIQNGLTSLRAPRFAEIISVFLAGTSAPFFWPAPFPDKILALRHQVFCGKKPYFRPMALTSLKALSNQKNISKEKLSKQHENKTWLGESKEWRRQFHYCAPASARDSSLACWHPLVERQSILLIKGIKVWHWAADGDPFSARRHLLVARQSISIGTSVEINVVVLPSASRDEKGSSVGTDRQRHGESSTARMQNLEDSLSTAAPANGLSQQTEYQASNRVRRLRLEWSPSVAALAVMRSIEESGDWLCWADCYGGPSLERCRPPVVVQAAAKNSEGPEDWWCRSDGGGGPSLERSRPHVVVLTSNKSVAFGAGSPYFEGVAKLADCGVTIVVCNDIKKVIFQRFF